MVLELKNVSVRYQVKRSRATADVFRSLLHRKKEPDGFLALDNVSFSLEKGDMLGVIGKNGAGKSTMMKAISGTLSPVAGTVEKHGTVCALLELGTGFDREMTVKENIYLRGAFLGYSREFMDSKYDEIIDFAEMRAFQDNPFRTLSSGMKSRVAFAIAGLVEPDIIILDEVFAVGDGQFRQKSKNRMKEIIHNGNTTAIMVSHSMDTIREQCNKALWMDHGRMVMMGDPQTVCDAYQKFLDTGVLPELAPSDAERCAEAEKRGKRRKGLLHAVVAALLIYVVAVSCLAWAQYDILSAYGVSEMLTKDEISARIENCRDRSDRLASDNAENWDTSIFAEHAPDILSDELSSAEVARRVMKDAGESSDSNHGIAYCGARITALKHYYLLRAERLVKRIIKEYDEKQPNVSLRVYLYQNRARLYALETRCDSDIQGLVADIREILRENEMEEDAAEQIWNLYREEKQLAIAYFWELCAEH